MPRYFFDFDDGAQLSADNEGFDFPGPKAARDVAVAALHEISKELFADGDRRHISVIVRHEGGRAIFEAGLSLLAKWLR